MKIDDKIRDKKLQYDTNREAAKISALSSGKIDKYEYLTGEEILPSDQRRVIEQVQFTYSALGKTLEKQIKIIEDQGEKQKKALEKHGKQLVESNELVKRILISTKIAYHLKNKKRYLMNLLNKRSSEFWDLEKRINPDNLIYKYKTEGRSPKELVFIKIR